MALELSHSLYQPGRTDQFNTRFEYHQTPNLPIEAGFSDSTRMAAGKETLDRIMEKIANSINTVLSC
jgi:hypothetical protein